MSTARRAATTAATRSRNTSRRPSTWRSDGSWSRSRRRSGATAVTTGAAPRPAAVLRWRGHGTRRRSAVGQHTGRPVVRRRPRREDLGAAARAVDDLEDRLDLHRWTDLERAIRVQRGDDADVERRLQLAAERRPHVGQGAVLRWRQGDRHRHGDAEVGQRSVEQVGGHGVVAQERHEQRREQAVLVLGALGPRRDEVGEAEELRLRPALLDDPVLVADGDLADVVAVHVLADVVEVDVDRRLVAMARPVLRRRVEVDRHLTVGGDVTLHEGAQGGVELVEHPGSHDAPFRPRRECPPGQRRGRSICPVRQSSTGSRTRRKRLRPDPGRRCDHDPDRNEARRTSGDGRDAAEADVAHARCRPSAGGGWPGGSGGSSCRRRGTSRP